MKKKAKRYMSPQLEEKIKTTDLKDFHRQALKDFAAWMDKQKPDKVTAADILREVNKTFPLPGSGMREDFKGAHSLTLTPDGRLLVTVWCEDMSWNLTWS